MYRGEVATDDILLRNIDDIGKANSTQSFGDDAHACTMDRCIDDLQVVVACDGVLLWCREGSYTLDEALVELFP